MTGPLGAAGLSPTAGAYKRGPAEARTGNKGDANDQSAFDRVLEHAQRPDRAEAPEVAKRGGKGSAVTWRSAGEDAHEAPGDGPADECSADPLSRDAPAGQFDGDRALPSSKESQADPNSSLATVLGQLAAVSEPGSAKASAMAGQAGSEADGTTAFLPDTPIAKPAKTVVATLAVVRQETHFAPLASPNHHGGHARGAEPHKGSDVAASLESSSPHADAWPAEVHANTQALGSVSTLAQSELVNSSVPSLSPIQQIARQLVVEEARAAGAVQTETPSILSPTTPVKVLHIELYPIELGTVSVRMSLKQDVLELRVEAARYETARLIERDKEALAQVLRSAGYDLDDTRVQVSVVGPGTAASAASSSLASSTHSEAGRSQSGNRQPGEGRSAGGRGDWQHGSGGKDEEAAGPRGRSSHLYV